MNFKEYTLYDSVRWGESRLAIVFAVVDGESCVRVSFYERNPSDMIWRRLADGDTVVVCGKPWTSLRGPVEVGTARLYWGWFQERGFVTENGMS